MSKHLSRANQFMTKAGYRSLLVAVVVCSSFFTASAFGQVVLSENFEPPTVTAGLGVTGTVGAFHTTGGSNVDVVGGALFGALCVAPESGNCIDMNGSGGANPVGQLASNTAFGPGSYLLSFDLIGSQRCPTTPTASVTVNFGNYNRTFNLACTDVTTGIVVDALVTVSGLPSPLTFVSNTLTDDEGLLLDNVTIVQVVNIFQDGPYQVGYAANLNIGDSVVNISNDGVNGGFFSAKGPGTICANVYVFDAAEEEISCCYCLVTPNGLNSLSAKGDLISNTLTPAVPSSIVIKLVASTPTFTIAAPTVPTCDPTGVTVPIGPAPGPNTLTNGLLAWGATLEPAGGPNTFAPVSVRFLNANLGTNGELSDLATVCRFVQAEGSGFGVCSSCRLGGLGGAKK